MAGLSDVLETTKLEKVAGGFVFTEGPLWHPDGFFYFVDIRQNLLYRMVLARSRRWCARPSAAMARRSTCRGG
jgi:gluconolactonase